MFEMPNEDKIHIKIRILKMSILGPNAKSEWMDDANNVTTVNVFSHRCWYEGFIDVTHAQKYANEEKVHREGNGIGAIVSLCGGLKGVFLTDNTEYYIEPDQTVTSSSQSQEMRHVIISRPIKSKPDIVTSGDWMSQDEADDDNYIHSNSDTSRHKRSPLLRRSPRHMEILLVADLSVVRFHGRSLADQYLLTQLNIVNSVYHHPSLGVEINIVVVDIVYLSDSEMKALTTDEEDEKGESNGKNTLKRFCSWTNERWLQSHVTGHRFDVAVYLTKHNIGPAGYAPVSGMCKPERSCAVIRDDGISSAFVIAHEIGHIFGMVHDEENQTEICATNTSDGKIMSNMVESNYHSYYWSNCSRNTMETVLGDMQCLTNQPTKRHWPQYTEPYGQSWTLNEQCRQEFGTGFSFCQAIKHNCVHLWCQNSTDQMCRTKRSPPLPGTTCGDNMWCINRMCVSKHHTPRVDGGWSNWSEWGECSRSCGIGAHYRYRTCSNPIPQYGGQQCTGNAEDFRICNQKPCENITDSRAEQCSTYDEMNFHGDRRHNWLPVETKNSSELCKLTCKSQENRVTFTTEKNVIDGTSCSYENPNDICIKGECHHVGCDGALGSGLAEDLCGVCGGDNSGCTRVSDRYTGTSLGKKQYHRVLILPQHAMNIRIRESESNPHLAHFMAIRDPETERFWLNGHEKRENSQQFVVHKTRFLYLTTRTGESLTARGPLLKPLEFMIYSYSEKLPTLIEYQYYLPKDVDRNAQSLVGPALEPGRYRWGLVAYSKCTKECGGGTRREKFECIDVEKNTVRDGLCAISDRPTTVTKTCNDHPCTETVYSWATDPWDKCSSSCGMNGWKRRHIRCEATLNHDHWQVEPYLCNISKLPIAIKQCQRMPCPAQWQLGPWSQCSMTCGEGIQTRTYYCAKPSDGNKYTCDHLQTPVSVRTCHQQPCKGLIPSMFTEFPTSSTLTVVQPRKHTKTTPNAPLPDGANDDESDEISEETDLETVEKTYGDDKDGQENMPPTPSEPRRNPEELTNRVTMVTPSSDTMDTADDSKSDIQIDNEHDEVKILLNPKIIEETEDPNEHDEGDSDVDMTSKEPNKAGKRVRTEPKGRSSDPRKPKKKAGKKRIRKFRKHVKHTHKRKNASRRKNRKRQRHNENIIMSDSSLSSTTSKEDRHREESHNNNDLFTNGMEESPLKSRKNLSRKISDVDRHKSRRKYHKDAWKSHKGLLCQRDRSPLVCRAGASLWNCRRALYKKLCCKSCRDALRGILS